MNKLKFTKDEGSEFYKELNEKIEQHFTEKGIRKTGDKTMIFKIILYFSLDILFYVLMITSTTTIGFFTFYLLMGLSVLLTAFNISHDAAHGVAVKSKFWNKLLFSLSFKETTLTFGGKITTNHIIYTPMLKEATLTF